MILVVFGVKQRNFLWLRIGSREATLRIGRASRKLRSRYKKTKTSHHPGSNLRFERMAPAIPNASNVCEESVCTNSINNKAMVLAVSDADLALDCVARMLTIACPSQDGSDTSLVKPIEIDDQRRTSSWPLVTKYYNAMLHVELVTNEHLNLLKAEHDDVQAVMIVLDSHEQELLIPLLTRWSSSSAQSRLLVLNSKNDSPIDEDSWHEKCFDHDFEFHNVSDLSEASMSWQCCKWPRLQRRLSLDDPQSSLPLSNSKQLLAAHGPENSQTIWQPLHAKNNPSSSDADNFEDDFEPFVSAETSTEWGETASTYDFPTADEIDETSRMLFGDANDTDKFEDFEGLVKKLNLLKHRASQMDEKPREHFAARVALAVEKQLVLE
ncbi:hypothetical protein O181_043139 [Austropuccinia psidii MF-1]|uniref:Uncharacterized protein n=1 Tax=Austropuccinia psidii MF-1 TaxID=1389203 RepID=A0A9Q3HI52_9BASI|nr:hypothetical protein [Austropuccinia psidii MF-1]